MGSNLWRESAPELNVFKSLMVNTGTGAQLQPRYTTPPPLQHWMAGDHKPSLQKKCHTQRTHHLPWAGAGTRHLSQPHSQLSQHHHQAPLSFGNSPWWLLELLPCLICVFVLSISFSSFPSTAPRTWAPEENFPALVTDAHSGTERLEHSSDQKMLWQLGPCSVAQRGGCNQPLPGSALMENYYTGKALVLQSHCIIYDLMIAHWLAGIIHSWRCFWVNERASTSLLSHPCSSEAISSFLSAP